MCIDASNSEQNSKPRAGHQCRPGRRGQRRTLSFVNNSLTLLSVLMTRLILELNHEVKLNVKRWREEDFMADSPSCLHPPALWSGQVQQPFPVELVESEPTETH